MGDRMPPLAPQRRNSTVQLPWTAMDVVEWEARPELRNPVALVAFEGWNDAADAASGAVGFILD